MNSIAYQTLKLFLWNGNPSQCDRCRRNGLRVKIFDEVWDFRVSVFSLCSEMHFCIKYICYNQRVHVAQLCTINYIIWMSIKANSQGISWCHLNRQYDSQCCVEPVLRMCTAQMKPTLRLFVDLFICHSGAWSQQDWSCALSSRFNTAFHCQSWLMESFIMIIMISPQYLFPAGFHSVGSIIHHVKTKPSFSMSTTWRIVLLRVF